MARLEQTEPELANYLFETLTTIYHELITLHGGPARTRQIYRQVEMMTLVCIQSLRQSHYELWTSQMDNPCQYTPPRPDGDDRRHPKTPA